MDLRASSSEPILSAVDPSLYPASVHGDSVQTTAHPRTGTAGDRQDTPRGYFRTVHQSHFGAERESLRLPFVPAGKISFQSIMQSLNMIENNNGANNRFSV